MISPISVYVCRSSFLSSQSPQIRGSAVFYPGQTSETFIPAQRALRRTSGRGAMGFYRMSEVKRHYDLLETLGSGSFAIVKRATRLQPSSEVNIPEHVAIKIIDKAKVDDMLDIRVRSLPQCPSLYGYRVGESFLNVCLAAPARNRSVGGYLSPQRHHTLRDL